ncbi:Rpn family recombination-promoting nuclease/putative transposase [uncultured Fibrobacter sp.]|uniref:Rpn family recombination-promoting nuclease/putative transposase n=1 Tax=uncultured Fibrobacter sp. TaxID=261512 RepID=UPI0025E2E2AF|nr:Rpn family recombination-promoting nuclease/putative transposase [uncultured Fibrobacter sp.]
MAKRKPLKDCIVKPGEKSPFANLLVDLAFKKAFDPDKPSSRENLVNLLNDLLEPQLKRPIKNVWTRNVAKNLSGSRESRTAIFDLHCEDDMGNLIEIEVQIRKQDHFLKRLAFYASEIIANQAEPGDDWNYDIKPTYVIAFARHKVFDDNRIVHRAAVTDLETGAQFVDAYNFTTVELSKVPFFIKKKSDDLSKWLFFFRFLNRLKELPAELDEKKFEHLTESSKVSNFSKEEFEVYQKMYHEKWDHNVMVDGVFEEFAKEIDAKVAESVSEKTREMAKAMRDYGDPAEKIAAISGLSIEEIARL